MLFDLDDTLVPEVAAWSAALRAASADFCQGHGIDASHLEAAVFGAARTLWDTSPHAAWCEALGLGSPSSLLSEIPGESPELRSLRAWSDRYRVDSWAQGLTDVGVRGNDVSAALPSGFRREFARAHRAFDDVEPTLGALQHLPLAIVTNGFSDLQRSKMQLSGLESHFAVVVISSECGIGKPDERLFRIALEALGVTAAEAVMVGDSHARDIDGALRAGMRAVWLDRDQRLIEPSTPHDRIVTLTELPALIERYR